MTGHPAVCTYELNQFRFKKEIGWNWFTKRVKHREDRRSRCLFSVNMFQSFTLNLCKLKNVEGRWWILGSQEVYAVCTPGGPLYSAFILVCISVSVYKMQGRPFSGAPCYQNQDNLTMWSNCYVNLDNHTVQCLVEHGGEASRITKP